MLRRILLCISLLVMLQPSASQNANAFVPEQGGIELISSSEKGISFEVQVPWQEIVLQDVSLDGSTYTKVSLADWIAFGRAGIPELPVMTATFAIPFGVEISLKVSPGTSHSTTLNHPVLPIAEQTFEEPSLSDSILFSGSPTQKLVYQPDMLIYNADAAFPGSWAEITNEGVFRQQRLVGITVFPLQYRPQSNRMEVYKSIRVDIVFEGESLYTQKLIGKDSELFESAYENAIINYKSSIPWRQTDLSSALTTQGNATDSQTPWMPPSPGWRVSVIEEGFYKLSYLELEAANVPVASLSLSNLQMFNMGSEIAIQIVDNNSNNQFDLDDFIIFYAQALDSKYSAENIYWLTYGQGLGVRMQARDVSPDSDPPSPTPADFPAILHYEENLYYATSISGPDELDRFVWGYISTPYVQQLSTPFELPPKTADATETLRLALVGYSQDPYIPLEHHALIKINDVVVGDSSWDNREWNIIEVTLPTGLLVEGINALTISSLSTHNDAYYVDWFEVGVSQKYIAESDSIEFSYPETGSWQFLISNFTTPDLVAYDISNANNPVNLTGLNINETTFEVKFDDEIVGDTNYWISAIANYLSPESITEDSPSQLRMGENQADYLLITHELFAEELGDLMNLRASQGLQVLKVDVQDIYDEFNFGITSAIAIRDFLAYAWSNWAQVPSVVVLVGDGHYNPKNYNPGSDVWKNYGFGRTSYIPPYLAMVEPNIGETATDNRYVTIVGTDTLPDMMIGRLAVNSVDEVRAFVNKIADYEQSVADGSWDLGVTLVADNPDTAGNFQHSSELLRSCCIPQPYQQERIYLGTTHSTDELAKAALIASINSGKLLVNFIGHGAYSEWGGWDSNPALSGDMLATADVGGLTNVEKYPVVLAMTCAEGMFHHPHPLGSFLESMAEVITKAQNKGAVASWSPTGWGLATGHDLLNRGFVTAALVNKVNTIGQATTSGLVNLWSSGNYLDLIDTYLFFGDPALVLKRGLEPAIYQFLPLLLR